MHILLLVMAMCFSTPTWAIENSHEVAAKKFYKGWMSFEKSKFVKAMFSTTTQADNETLQAWISEALESPEVEAICVKNLVSTFSEQELLALTDMVSTPAYRTYSERMPQFMTQFGPEFASYLKNNSSKLIKRVEEKRKAR